MPAEWSTVRVFISSTFRDMHAERDHLVKVVFPALRERLEPHHLHLVDIDLRWGITAEQAERDQVLDLCLDFIDECRPFFLGILGERYGWVPSTLPDTGSKYGWTQLHTGRSVTDLEIQWGVLLNPQMRGHSLFFYRDPAFLDEVPSELRATFAAEDDESVRKQTELKQAIREANLPFAPITYSCRFAGLRMHWNIAQLGLSAADRAALESAASDGLIDVDEYRRLTPVHQEQARRAGIPYLSGLEQFGRQVLDSLWSAIQTKYRLGEVSAAVPSAVDPQQAENSYHERFMESRLRVYVGRQELGDQLTDFVLGNGRVPCVVSGRSGTGKSAALANFVRQFSRSYPDELVIPHFIGASPDSTNLRQLLIRLCSHLAARLNVVEDLPTDVESLAHELRRLIGLVPAHRRVVIVLDALDQLDESDLARGLSWLPADLPEHIKFVVSAIELPDRVHPVQEELSQRNCVRFAVMPLTNVERMEIVETVPSISAKSLDASQIALLLDNPETTNPLYLFVALEELRGFGSFEQLNRRIALFPRGGDAVTALFNQVIERLESEFDSSTVRTVLTSLAASRRGMSDRELLDLSEGPAVSVVDTKGHLFPILRQLRAYLQRRGPLIGFFHRNLDRAVRERFFVEDSVQASAHQRLADYFQQQENFLESVEAQRLRMKMLPPTARPVNLRKVDELPWQLLQAAKLTRSDDPQSSQWNALADLLMDWRFLEAKAEAGQRGVQSAGSVMIFELAEDFTQTLAALPEQHPRRRLLMLLLEAIRRNIHFVDRHPTTLFQCLWNSGWWFDSENAVGHFVPPASGWSDDYAWKRPGAKLSAWLETWRKEKNRHTPGFTWVRARRPPPTALGSRQQLLLSGHENTVVDLAWSPDGAELVSVSYDKTARIWNTRSGVNTATLEGPQDYLMCVAYAGDGRRIAAAESTGRILLWDAITRNPVPNWNVDGAPRAALAFSPDSTTLLSGDNEAKVRRWNLRTLQEYDVLPMPAPVLAVAYSPDGSRFATALEDKTVRIWNAADGREASALRRHLEVDGKSLRFSPDGQWLAAGTLRGAQLWKLKPSAEISVAQVSETIDQAFVLSPDSTWFAASSSRPLYDREVLLGIGDLPGCESEARIRICDAETGAERASFIAHKKTILGIALSPQGDLIASCSYDDMLRIWDVSSSQEIRALRPSDSYSQSFNAVAFSPDGHTISAANRGKVYSWNLETGEESAVFEELESRVNVLVYAPDGQLICGCADGSIRMQAQRELTFSWQFVGHQQSVLCLAVSADGTWLASGSEDNTARLWRLADGVELAVLRGHAEKINCVAFSPDGSLLITGSDDKTVQVWDTTTGSRRAMLKGHVDEVHSVAFHHDGSRFYSGSKKSVRTWNPEGDPDAEMVLLGDKTVYRLSFSPDGDSLVCADKDRTVCIWDLHTRTRKALLAGHQDDIHCVAYSPDGTLIASGSEDRTICIWSAVAPPLNTVAPEVRGDRWRFPSMHTSPDGRFALMNAYLWNVETAVGKELTCFRSSGPDGWGPPEAWHPSSAGPVAFSYPFGMSSGMDLAAVLGDRTLRTFLLLTAQEVAPVADLKQRPAFVEYSFTGFNLAVADGNSVAIWSIAGSAELGALRGHDEAVRCAAWSPDNTMLATGSHDKTVRIWNASTYAERNVLRGHEEGITCLVFSPDSRRIASGDTVHKIRVWDAATGQLEVELVGQPPHVKKLAFSPDGGRLYSCAWDDTLYEFEIATQAILRTFTGMPDVAAIAGGCGILSHRARLDTVFFDAVTGQDVGWYPEPLKNLTAASATRTWSGLSADRLHLVRLETEPEIMDSPEPPSNSPKKPAPDTWWTRLLRKLFGTVYQ